MGDGHTGISNKYGERVEKGAFDLSLSYLKERDTGGYFVMHVLPKMSTMGTGLDASELLGMLKFEKSRDTCEPFGKQCYYKYVFEREIDGWREDDAVRYAHSKFNRFADSIDEIYSDAQRVIQRLEEHVDLFPWAERFRTEPKLIKISGTEPAWLVELRVKEHRDLLDGLEEMEKRRKEFQAIEYCLWGKGDKLVDSVQYVLSEVGLDARKTEKGATVDLILPYPAKDLEIGIEVTGLNTAIKKDSNKFNQAFEYLQHCEGDCKALILANTYNDATPSERRALDDFTKQAVDIMKPMGIVGLTTMGLYRIWKAVVYDGVDIDSIIGEICDHEGGVYRYPCQGLA